MGIGEPKKDSVRARPPVARLTGWWSGGLSRWGVTSLAQPIVHRHHQLGVGCVTAQYPYGIARTRNELVFTILQETGCKGGVDQVVSFRCSCCPGYGSLGFALTGYPNCLSIDIGLF